MAFSQQELDALLLDEAQEGLYLELKRGTAAGASNDQRSELVKDCVGFANAGGGTIVYGIEEQIVDGIGVAAGLPPGCRLSSLLSSEKTGSAKCCAATRILHLATFKSTKLLYQRKLAVLW